MKLPHSMKCFNMTTAVTSKATPPTFALAALLCFFCSGVLVVEAVTEQVPKSIEAQQVAFAAERYRVLRVGTSLPPGQVLVHGLRCHQIAAALLNADFRTVLSKRTLGSSSCHQRHAPCVAQLPVITKLLSGIPGPPAPPARASQEGKLAARSGEQMVMLPARTSSEKSSYRRSAVVMLALQGKPESASTLVLTSLAVLVARDHQHRSTRLARAMPRSLWKLPLHSGHGSNESLQPHGNVLTCARKPSPRASPRLLELSGFRHRTVLNHDASKRQLWWVVPWLNTDSLRLAPSTSMSGTA